MWSAILLLMHHRCTEVFAILFCWCLCPHCTGVFVVLMLAYLPLLRCCLCPRCACWHHCLCRADVSTVVALALLPLLRWHLALVALESLPEFCTGVNHPHHGDIFTIILLALSSKAHIALVSLPLCHWRYHCCVVPTNIGACVIASCIGTHGPLHLFTAVRDIVFNQSLDCDAMSQVGGGYS
jgi:hypothetical protein